MKKLILSALILLSATFGATYRIYIPNRTYSGEWFTYEWKFINDSSVQFVDVRTGKKVIVCGQFVIEEIQTLGETK